MRWQKRPEFKKAFREARRTVFGQTTARLHQASPAAATVLMKTMLDPSTPASVKVRAADCIINYTHKAIEIEDIDARVAALEAVRDEEDKQW